MDNMKFYVAESLNDSFTWYIFRENKQEIKVKIVNNMLFPSHNLTKNEVNYFREFILEKKTGCNPIKTNLSSQSQ